jgi:hypothetical protein
MRFILKRSSRCFAKYAALRESGTILVAMPKDFRRDELPLVLDAQKRVPPFIGAFGAQAVSRNGFFLLILVSSVCFVGKRFTGARPWDHARAVPASQKGAVCSGKGWHEFDRRSAFPRRAGARIRKRS